MRLMAEPFTVPRTESSALLAHPPRVDRIHAARAIEARRRFDDEAAARTARGRGLTPVTYETTPVERQPFLRLRIMAALRNPALHWWGLLALAVAVGAWVGCLATLRWVAA